MKKSIALIAFLTIALSASSQTGLPATHNPDSLTCYTPTQQRQIAKALTELDYCREQIETNRQIIAKGHELHTHTTTLLNAAQTENADLQTQNIRLKKGRKWWFAAGTTLGIALTIWLL